MASALITMRVLADEEVNLASETGRERTQAVIGDALRTYQAEALNGQAPELSPADREAIARELHDDLIGLGALAERMLADPEAQEWMINGPKRVFRDSGQRIERVPGIVFRRRSPSPRLPGPAARTGRGQAARPHDPARRGAPPRRVAPGRCHPTDLVQRQHDLLDPPLRLAAGDLDELVRLGSSVIRRAPS